MSNPPVNQNSPEAIKRNRDLQSTSPSAGTNPQEALQDARIDQQKSSFRQWMEENVYSTPESWGGGVLGWMGAGLGTAGKLLFAQPVKGLVRTGATTVLSPLIGRTGARFTGEVLGEIARFGTLGLAAWGALGALRHGSDVAFQGGNTILDRIGVGGGHLFPSMDIPAPSPSVQPLPSGDVWSGA